MGWIDAWHRRSLVYREMVDEYEARLWQAFHQRKDLTEKVGELRDIVADKIQEIVVLKKIGETGVSAEQHRWAVGECERLRFINEELERDIATLKQKVYDLEQELVTVVRPVTVELQGPFVEPKRPKKVMDSLKPKDVVVLESSVSKPKTKVTKKPVKKTKAPAKSKPSPWLKVR